MSEQQARQPTEPKPAPDSTEPASPPQTANSSAPGKESKVSELTAEEQMALYEKELKENDWGHQPC